MSSPRSRPARLPPGGLPGLDPRWSRLVPIIDADGIERTFHVLDSWAGLDQDADQVGPAPIGTLLCVHGNPTWSYLWRRLVAAAPAGWRVIAPDQLGMGYSERIDRPRVLAERIDDLSRLTAALGVTGTGSTGSGSTGSGSTGSGSTGICHDPPDAMGRPAGPVVTVAHDWGGIISLGWALRHRDQLAGVVLTNTAVHQPESSAGPVLIRLAHVPFVNEIACRRTPLFVRATTALSRPPLPRDIRAAFSGPYCSTARRIPVGEFVADIPFAEGHPSRPRLDEIAEGIRGLDVPALILWGPRDPVFGEAHLRDLLARLPQSRLHRYETAGHLLPEDAPDYPAAVVGWLAGISLSVDENLVSSTTLEPQVVAGPTGESSDAVVDVAGAADAQHEKYPPAGHLGSSVLAALDARSTDDSPAVVEIGGASISWAELHERVDRIARGFDVAGIEPGDRVALLIPPSIELTVALYAVWRAGAVIVVADKGLGLRGMGRALRSARIDHLIADTAGLLVAGPMRLPGTRIAVHEGFSIATRISRARLSLPALARSGDADEPLPGIDPEAEAAVLFTSGATGPAKGVRYRQRQLSAQLVLIRQTYRLTPQDRIVAAFAPFALYGPALGIPSAVPDTDVTKPGTLTAAALGEAAARIDATVVFASPAALRNVLATAADLSGPQRAALGRVRLLMSAGAPVPAVLLRRLQAVLPNAEMHTPYGMTEALPVTDISLAEIEAAGAGDGVCVGRPLNRVQIRIAALDKTGVASEVLTETVGVTGEIWVAADHVKDSYDALWLTDRQAGAHHGWHRTGDVGMVDADGRWWVQGRSVHVITTTDGPVTPVGLEQRVSRAVEADTAVVGVGPAGIQQVVVVVVGDAGPLASEGLTTTVRAAAGRPIAAVLVKNRLPVDIRHNSKVDRVAVARWATTVLAGG